jgi:antitoxin (DNA-binding transcriptional repressor) of toxin-antitoxin stability system
MNRYTASEARKRISALLDGAEQGETVLIERNGVRFRLSVDRAGPTRAPAAGSKPALEIRDPAVEAGQWTWRSNPAGPGLSFSAKRGKHGVAKLSR